jgi:hypothetical protein
MSEHLSPPLAPWLLTLFPQGVLRSRASPQGVPFPAGFVTHVSAQGIPLSPFKLGVGGCWAECQVCHFRLSADTLR